MYNEYVMRIIKLLSWALLILLVILIILVTGIYFYKDSKVVTNSNFISLALNGSESKTIKIDVGDSLAIDWKVDGKLSGYKCTLVGPDDAGNSYRDIAYSGKLALTNLTKGDYYYTVSCVNNDYTNQKSAEVIVN